MGVNREASARVETLREVNMKKNEKKDNKNKKQNVLLFPASREEPAISPMIFQIGAERFAIHWEIEDLPSPPPVLLLHSPRNGKTTTRRAPRVSGR
jgi:hypothetical protein